MRSMRGAVSIKRTVIFTHIQLFATADSELRRFCLRRTVVCSRSLGSPPRAGTALWCLPGAVYPPCHSAGEGRCDDEADCSVFFDEGQLTIEAHQRWGRLGRVSSRSECRPHLLGQKTGRGRGCAGATCRRQGRHQQWRRSRAADRPPQPPSGASGGACRLPHTRTSCDAST